MVKKKLSSKKGASKSKGKKKKLSLIRTAGSAPLLLRPVIKGGESSWLD